MKRIEWILTVILFLLSFIAYELLLILDGIQGGTSPLGLLLIPILPFLIGVPVYVVVYGGYRLVSNIIEPQ